MLTLKLISEETERVIKGLEKKHFADAEQAIQQVLAVDKQRREAQDRWFDEGRKEGRGQCCERICFPAEGDQQATGGTDEQGTGGTDHPALSDSEYPL